MSIFLLHVFQLSGVFQWRHTTGISWYLWCVCGTSPVYKILVACPRHATDQLSALPCWWHSEITPPTGYFLLVHMDGLRNWRILDHFQLHMYTHESTSHAHLYPLHSWYSSCQYVTLFHLYCSSQNLPWTVQGYFLRLILLEAPLWSRSRDLTMVFHVGP
jgi:hypothetical protein